VMRDGRLNKCIECTKNDVKTRSVLESDKVHQYDRERSKSAKRKLCATKHQIEWRKNNPEKYKAHNAVNNALRDGKITKPSACEICGNERPLHGHHYDYALPLDVIWICEECHAQIQ
jgi:hypothetical protein